jgi:hypothetical protein
VRGAASGRPEVGRASAESHGARIRGAGGCTVLCVCGFVSVCVRAYMRGCVGSVRVRAGVGSGAGAWVSRRWAPRHSTTCAADYRLELSGSENTTGHIEQGATVSSSALNISARTRACICPSDPLAASVSRSASFSSSRLLITGGQNWREPVCGPVQVKESVEAFDMTGALVRRTSAQRGGLREKRSELTVLAAFAVF